MCAHLLSHALLALLAINAVLALLLSATALRLCATCGALRPHVGLHVGLVTAITCCSSLCSGRSARRAALWRRLRRVLDFFALLRHASFYACVCACFLGVCVGGTTKSKNLSTRLERR